MAEQSGDFWLLDNDTVQGQAGKPFIHQRGPLLKFPDQEQEVDNSCLCKYRYMRYFAFYQYVEEQTKELTFFKDLSQDQQGFIDYSTQQVQGYNWQHLSGPHYLGCFPAGTFQLGQWLPVNLPYSDYEDQDHKNITSPSPYYIYKTEQPNKASLKCMIVCSYKCCNGQKGCGREVPREDEWTTSAFPLCIQDFHVSNLQEAVSENNADLAVATAIPGTMNCCTYRYKKLQKLNNCDSAVIRAAQQMTTSSEQCPQDDGATCRECLQWLPQIAKARAFQLAKNNKCVNWMLWRWDFTECDPCQASQVHAQFVYTYQGVPQQVIGKGGGWAPKNWHDPQKKYIYCSEGSATVYQWTFSQNKDLAPQDFLPPADLTENPCKDNCSNNGQKDTHVSDSLSGISDSKIPEAQLPCNTPDPSSRQYKQFYFQDFDIWYLKISKTEEAEGTAVADPCFDTYKIDPQSLYQNGKPKWTRQEIWQKDFQLQQKGYIKGLQFRPFKDKDKVYIAIPSQQDPPQDFDDARLSHLNFQQGLDGFFVQDTTKNNCQFLYQTYFFKCTCEDPCAQASVQCQDPKAYAGSNGCSKWNRIGQLNESVLAQRGIELGCWQKSTIQNTFSDPQTGPIGQFVFSVYSPDTSYCKDAPELEAQVSWREVSYIAKVDQRCIVTGQSQIQETTRVEQLPYCQALRIFTKFKSGYKKTQDTFADPDYTVQNNRIQITDDTCKIYYIDCPRFSPVLCDPAAQPSECPVLPQVTITWPQQCSNFRYTVVCVQLGWQNLHQSSQAALFTWHTGKMEARVFQQNFGTYGIDMHVSHTMYLPSGFGVTGGQVSIQAMQGALTGQSGIQGTCEMNLGGGHFFFYVQVQGCDQHPIPSWPEFPVAYLGVNASNQIYKLLQEWCLVYVEGTVKQEFIDRQNVPVIKATGQVGKTDALIRYGAREPQYTVVPGDSSKLGKAQVHISDVYCSQGIVYATGSVTVYPDALRWGACHAAELADPNILNRVDTITLSQLASNIRHIYNDIYQFEDKTAQCDGTAVEGFTLRCLPYGAAPGSAQYPWIDGTTARVYVQGAGGPRFLIRREYYCQYFETDPQGNTQYYWQPYFGQDQPDAGWCQAYSQSYGDYTYGCTGNTKVEEVYYAWAGCGCAANSSYLTIWSDNPQFNQGFDIYIDPYQWVYASNSSGPITTVCYYPVSGNYSARPASALAYYAAYADANPAYDCLPSQLPEPKLQRTGGNIPIGVHVRAYWSYSCGSYWQFQGTYYIPLNQQTFDQTYAFGISAEYKDSYPYIDQFNVRFRYNTKG